MTATEILDKKNVWLFRKGRMYDEQDVKDAMIEHTKYHVTQALKEASKKAKNNWLTQMPDRNSILNAYPLENIK